jgi:hypothetical protein
MPDRARRDLLKTVLAAKLSDTGHWLMEERQAETEAALKKFFGG